MKGEEIKEAVEKAIDFLAETKAAYIGFTICGYSVTISPPTEEVNGFTASKGAGYFSCDDSNGSIGEMCQKGILRWVIDNWSKDNGKISMNTDCAQPFHEGFFKIEFITKDEYESVKGAV